MCCDWLMTNDVSFRIWYLVFRWQVATMTSVWVNSLLIKFPTLYNLMLIIFFHVTYGLPNQRFPRMFTYNSLCIHTIHIVPNNCEEGMRDDSSVLRQLRRRDSCSSSISRTWSKRVPKSCVTEETTLTNE